MKALLRRSTYLLTLVVAASGCTPLNRVPRGGSPSPNPQATGYDIGIHQYDVSIDMAGDDVVDFNGTPELRIQVPQKSAPLNLLVVSTPGFLDVGNSVSLSIGIALIGLYEGDGRYVLQPHVGQPTPSAQEVSTFSRVTFYALNKSVEPPTNRAYDALGAPCEVTLAKNATRGKVDCPEIVSQEKTKVKFMMTWKPSS